MTFAPVPNDPEGAYFYTYPVKPPEGEWEYRLDEVGITYGPGPWPFYYAPHGGDRVPFGVRVSPDTEILSWGNEYVLLRPLLQDPEIVESKLRLYVRPQGLGAVVVAVRFGINLRQETAAVTPSCPPELREQADIKVARLLRFLLQHRTARDAGLSPEDIDPLRDTEEEGAVAAQPWRPRQR